MGTCVRHLFKHDLDDGDEPVEGRVLVTDLGDVLQEILTRHGLGLAAGQVLGELAVCASLLIPLVKEDEGQTLQLNVDGPLRRVVVDMTGQGTFRGYIGASELDDGEGTLGEQVDRLLGRRGQLNLLRFKDSKVLYRGSSAFQGGSVLSTFALYLQQSEQLSSSVHVSVELVSDEGKARVSRARGVLIQALGGQDPTRFRQVLEKVNHPLLMDGLRDGGAEANLQEILPGGRFEFMGVNPLGFECTCSRQRMEAALMALGAEDLEALMLEQGEGRVTCQFCSETHVFDMRDILGLIDRLNLQSDSADAQGDGSLVN